MVFFYSFFIFFYFLLFYFILFYSILFYLFFFYFPALIYFISLIYSDLLTNSFLHFSLSFLHWMTIFHLLITVLSRVSSSPPSPLPHDGSPVQLNNDPGPSTLHRSQGPSSKETQTPAPSPSPPSPPPWSRAPIHGATAVIFQPLVPSFSALLFSVESPYFLPPHPSPRCRPLQALSFLLPPFILDSS